ncbi:uncharacterized protein LOC121389400 isoform X2 [Gigantopelta aegis]|uniref:uncharacterized protein LOC121389400 isoform X2 n=1 Tax=Gigantopelta aegis TaxID=1735272 RepID=UPI001B88DE41|nr:uncharacterized protein LOC121389400 isoform X2 [Gigantopelta aegis]
MTICKRYPVTPFQIQIEKTIFEPCWVSVEMDGERVCYSLLQGQNRQTRVIDGRKCGDEIRELAFSLPLMTDETRAGQKRIDAAGSITVKLIEAVNIGLQSFIPATKVKTNYLPQGEFPQLSKQDVSKKENLGAVVREGRTILKLMYNQHQGRKTRIRYVKGKLLEEMTVHYRPLESLLDLGVILLDEYKRLKKSMTVDIEEPLVPCDTLPASSNSTDDKKKACTEEVQNIVSSDHVQNNIAAGSTLVKTESVTVNTLLKQEFPVTQTPCSNNGLPKVENGGEKMTSDFLNMKLEMTNSYDDVIYIEDDDVTYISSCVRDSNNDDIVCLGDESIIYLGDDSCYVFDTTPQDISMVDLTDDVPS